MKILADQNMPLVEQFFKDTAAMFASRKKKVIGVDVNQHAVDTINRGEISWY